MAGNEVTIHVRAKDGASKSFASIQGRAEVMSSRTGGALKKMAMAAAVAGVAIGTVIARGAFKAVMAASDLNETINKSSVIFGKNHKEIVAWANGAAKNMGLSKQAAMESAASFADMFLQLGFTGREATKMSKGIVQLSADLGSFNNLPTADVQERIAAAFRGEYDSLQALVPTINAAKVEQQAMATTGKKNADSLTQQEKAAAVLKIVTDSTKRAQGDFAKTSDGLANSLKSARARVEDLAAKFGTRLLPFTTGVVNKFGEFLDLLENSKKVKLSKNMQALFDTFQRVADEILPVVREEWKKIKKQVELTADAIVTAIDGDIIPALERFAGQNTETGKTFTRDTSSVIRFALKVMTFDVKRNFKTMAFTLDLTGRTMQQLGKVWKFVSDKMREAVTDLRTNTGRRFAEIRDSFMRTVHRVQRLLGTLRDAIASAIRFVRDTIRRGVTAFENSFDRFRRVVETKVRQVRNSIINTFRNARDWLASAGRNVLQGLWDGMTSKFNAVKRWVSGIAKWIKDHKGPISLDRQLLKPAGQALMGGLLEGLHFGFGPVGKFVYKAGSTVKSIIGQISAQTSIGKFLGSIFGGQLPVPGTGRRHTSGYGRADWAGDFPNPTGTPVRAWKSGVVTATNFWNYSYGNHVRLFHGLARTLYAHLSRIFVKSGQFVKAGQIIGAVGSTGNSTGPHLHFEKYARGGVIREPIMGIGRSGKGYMFGENGPETITPGIGTGRDIYITLNLSPDLSRVIKVNLDEHDRKARRAVAAGRSGF